MRQALSGTLVCVLPDPSNRLFLSYCLMQSIGEVQSIVLLQSFLYNSAVK